MARNPTQKANRLRLEAAAESAKATWHKAKAKAAGKSGAAKKLAEAEAYDAEAIYRRLRRRLKPRRKDEGLLGGLLKDLGM
jgi:hypothetical protein